MWNTQAPPGVFVCLFVFNTSSHSVPFHWEFNPFTFRVSIDIYLSTYYCHFIFCLLVILSFHCFFLTFVSLYLCRLVVFRGDLLLFPFFYVLCFCSQFLPCVNYEVSIKCLLDKPILSLLKATYLYSPIKVPSFYDSFFIYLVSQFYLFFCYEFVTKLW